MSGIDTSAWRHLGATSNAEFYEIEPHVMAVVPHDDTTDTADTARESIAFQDAHWKERGHRGAAVVFMDPVLVQDGGAREVYASETENTLSTCYALVGESFFAQATAAVFTGLSKPGIPTQVFRTLDDARSWIAEMNRAEGIGG